MVVLLGCPLLLLEFSLGQYSALPPARLSLCEGLSSLDLLDKALHSPHPSIQLLLHHQGQSLHHSTKEQSFL